MLEALQIVISVSLLVFGILILVYILPKLIYGKKLIRFGYPDEKGNATRLGGPMPEVWFRCKYWGYWTYPYS